MTMSDKTGIQWTDATWNPVSGCSKVSAGCKNCYAEHDWARLSKNPKSPYFGRDFTNVRCHPERLNQPLKWTKPRKIFVNSMSDLFHEDVSDNFIASVFYRMILAPQHTFQVLTKRPARMIKFFEDAGFYPVGPRGETGSRERLPWNIHLGVSVENQETADERIPLLLDTPAAVRFLSVEPLLESVNLKKWLPRKQANWQCMKCGGFVGGGLQTCPHCGADKSYLCGSHVANKPAPGTFTGWINRQPIDWVIVGGESGPNARPCNIGWIRAIVAQCHAARVPIFVKQLGSHPRWGTPKGVCAQSYAECERPLILRDRKGGDPAEWPADLQNCREFPR